MTEEDDRLRLNCTITAAELRKIEELAKRLEVSPSRLGSMLLKAGLQDNETIIRLMTSDFAKRVQDGLAALAPKPRKAKPKGSK